MASHGGDNGDRRLKAMGYIFVACFLRESRITKYIELSTSAGVLVFQRLSNVHLKITTKYAERGAVNMTKFSLFKGFHILEKTESCKTEK